MTKQHKGSNAFFNMETLIILIIAGCMIFLNVFTVSKLNELQDAEKKAVFLVDNVTFPDQEAFTEEVSHYLQESYKMIELYDANLNMLFQIQFSDELGSTNDITKYPKLMEIIKNNNEGQTSVMINDNEQEVYFKWVANEVGEHRLLVVYSSIKVVQGLWLFSFVCWLVMILIFVLLIRLHSTSYQNRINEYKSMMNSLRG